MATSETTEETATPCDERLAHYREACGKAWKPGDDTLFRIAWNEGAAERDRQMRAKLDEAERARADHARRSLEAQVRADAANALLDRALDAINQDAETILTRDIRNHLEGKAE